MKFISMILLSFAFVNLSFAQDSVAVENIFPQLKGEYLGQKPPGYKPEIFAPGIISTKENIEGSLTFSNDGKEFYFTKTEGTNPYGKTYIMVSRIIDSV